MDESRTAVPERPAEKLSGEAKAGAPESAGEGVRQARSLARENPVPIGMAGAFVAGLVVGRVLTRR